MVFWLELPFISPFRDVHVCVFSVLYTRGGIVNWIPGNPLLFICLYYCRCNFSKFLAVFSGFPFLQIMDAFNTFPYTTKCSMLNKSITYLSNIPVRTVIPINLISVLSINIGFLYKKKWEKKVYKIVIYLSFIRFWLTRILVHSLFILVCQCYRTNICRWRLFFLFELGGKTFVIL